MVIEYAILFVAMTMGRGEVFAISDCLVVTGVHYYLLLILSSILYTDSDKEIC